MSLFSFCLSGVIFYVCAILETNQLCCDLKASDLVAWIIHDVLQQFIENTVNKMRSWQTPTLSAEESFETGLCSSYLSRCVVPCLY